MVVAETFCIGGSSIGGASCPAGSKVLVTGSAGIVSPGACALGESCVNKKRVFFASLFTPVRERRKERKEAEPPLTGGRRSAARQARASGHAGATRAGRSREGDGEMWPGRRAQPELGAHAPRRPAYALAQSRQPRSLNTWRARWRTSPLRAFALSQITVREKNSDCDSFMSPW